MTEERYFKCEKCGQVVQGWAAANEWYNKECVDGPCHEWVEIYRDKQYIAAVHCGTGADGQRVRQGLHDWAEKQGMSLSGLVKGLAEKNTGLEKGENTMRDDITITIYELVNPARCEACGESAEFHVVISDSDHYYCYDHLPTLASIIISDHYAKRKTVGQKEKDVQAKEEVYPNCELLSWWRIS